MEPHVDGDETHMHVLKSAHTSNRQLGAVATEGQCLFANLLWGAVLDCVEHVSRVAWSTIVHPLTCLV